MQQVKQEKAKASLDSYRAETGKFQETCRQYRKYPLGVLQVESDLPKSSQLRRVGLWSPL